MQIVVPELHSAVGRVVVRVCVASVECRVDVQRGVTPNSGQAAGQHEEILELHPRLIGSRRDRRMSVLESRPRRNRTVTREVRSRYGWPSRFDCDGDWFP